MDCAKCGAPIRPGSEVCASCGTPVSDDTLVMGASTGAATRVAAPGSARAAATPVEEKPFWKKTWFWLVAATAVIIILVVIWLLMRGVDVPDVVGLSSEEAQVAAEEAGLAYVVSGTEYSTELEPGIVISQNPEAGASAKKDDQLSVVLSTDTELAVVPDVVGEMALAAVNILQAAGFTVSEIVGQESEEPQGTVIAQDPEAGAEADISTGIVLTMSEGPAAESVAVPNLVGMQQDVAEEMLNVLGLTSDSSTVASAAPLGEILAQTPAAGTTVASGDNVVLVASDGTGVTTTLPPTTSTSAATSTTMAGTTSTTIPNQVTIIGLLDQAFDPEEITVSRGDTVTWFNDDIEVHIILADDESFESEPMDPGDLFPFTFTQAGTIGYQCGLHPDEVGTVVVE